MSAYTGLFANDTFFKFFLLRFVTDQLIVLMIVKPVVAKVIMTTTIKPIIRKHCLLLSMKSRSSPLVFQITLLSIIFPRDFLTWRDIPKPFASSSCNIFYGSVVRVDYFAELLTHCEKFFGIFHYHRRLKECPRGDLNPHGLAANGF